MSLALPPAKAHSKKNLILVLSVYLVKMYNVYVKLYFDMVNFITV